MTTIRRSTIASPREALGFEPGEDRKLADWPQLVEYFRHLASASDRVLVREIGRSTEGNPFLLAIISSPRNLEDLECYRRIQARLADPRTIRDEGEAEELIAAGKAVVLVTCSIHATEVGATQMSPLLAHHLATSDGPEVQRVLDNVILLLVPCLNPDGLIKVKAWYDSTLGTPFEGVPPPFLYHKYAGHDNNRDWATFNLVETRLVVEHCLNAWHPQIAYDLHQTRSDGMRMVLPPYIDPVDPNVDPVLQAELAMLGSAMAAELTAQGKAGVAVNVVYDAYSPSRSYLHYHGGVRVLSEAASARIATPVELRPEDLRPARGEDPAQQAWNHPMPWRGGRWGLRDIVEYDFAATMACLGHAARYRDMWLRNFYLVGKKAVSGQQGPFAFLVPPDQHDPVAAAEMLQVLRTAQVEVHEALEPFAAEGRLYPAGTRAILMAQPYAAFARTMLAAQQYPDLRQYPGGPPRAPYDVTAHSLPLQMGVSIAEVRKPFQASLRLVDDVRPPRGQVVRRDPRTSTVYLLRPSSNASVRAVNRLLAAGVKVWRARDAFTAEGIAYPPGTYVMEDGSALASLVEQLARECCLDFAAVASAPTAPLAELRTPRVGVYKSYVPATEEGWTRLVLEDYGIPYTSLVDEEVRRRRLAERFDVIVLPSQRSRYLDEGHNPRHYPAAYAGGLGIAGASSLREFVEEGGTLVAWGGAAEYVRRRFELPVSNVLTGLASTEFYAPGSLLRVVLDTAHPIAYGMPRECAVMLVNGPAYDVRQGQVVGRYPSEGLVLSGWVIGQERLAGRAALAVVPVGRGQVVLIGFRVHFRAQARGTYKVLFNAIFHGAARPR